MNGPMSLPILRLELQGMVYQVVHALHTHNQDIEAQVEESVKQAVANFDIRGEVERITVQELRKSIESAVQSAVWRVFQDRQVKDAVRLAVQSALQGK